MEPKSQWGRLNTDLSGLHFDGEIETVPGCYQTYYQNIAAVLRGEAELVVKAEEALRTIRIIELAILSSSEKRTIDYSEE